MFLCDWNHRGQAAGKIDALQSDAIDRLEYLRAKDLRWRSFGGDFSFGQDDHSVGKRPGQIQLMRGKNDAQSLLGG